jgi:hypothetical protein
MTFKILPLGIGAFRAIRGRDHDDLDEIGVSQGLILRASPDVLARPRGLRKRASPKASD